MAEAVTDDELCKRLDELLAKATPGPWHHCQPYMTVPAQLTVHGPIPAERVDYVSTWPGKGTPSGHRVVIDMPGREGRVRSEDMALIAAMRNALPDLLARIRSLASENAGLREERDAYKGGWDSAQEEWQAARMVYFDLLDVCGCKDGGELQDKAQRAEAAETEVERLREALEPFARYFDWARRHEWPAAIAEDDLTPVAGREDPTGETEPVALYVGNFRRARATLEGRDG